MARYRKSSPIRDNLPGMLAGTASVLLVCFFIWAVPRVGPAVKSFLAGADSRPPVESAAQEQEAPSGESAPAAEEASPPEESGNSAEAADSQDFGGKVWAACKKLWPVILAAIAVMEAVEYTGKLFLWVRKLFR